MKKGGKIMKLDLNKFYNTNYKDFVHKEAIEEALRMVAEIELKDVEVDTILSITFSVDEYGENPMYIEYLDKDGKTHLVRIRPAVSNEIQEMLKRYVTLEQHEKDKEDIYNYIEDVNVPMEIRSQNELDEEGHKSIILNSDNAFISYQVDPDNDDTIQWLAIQNKNGNLGSQYQYFARFVDFAKTDEVPDNETFLEKIKELEELIHNGDEDVLLKAKQYADNQDYEHRNAVLSIMANIIDNAKNEINEVIDIKYDELKSYIDAKDTESREISKNYTDNAKQEAVAESNQYTNETVDGALTEAMGYTDTKMHEAVSTSKTYTDNKTDETLISGKNYTDTKHTETMQQIEELEDEVKPKITTLEENQVKLIHSDASQRGLTDSIVFGETSGKLTWLQLLKKSGEEAIFDVENFKNDILSSIPSMPTNVVTTEVLNTTLLGYVKNSQLSNYYTKTESDNRYAFKGEVPDVPESVVTNDKLSEVLAGYVKNEVLNNYYTKSESDSKYALKSDIPTSVDVKVNNSDNVTKMNYQTSDNCVELFNGNESLMRGNFISDTQVSNITKNTSKLSTVADTHKVPDSYWYGGTNIGWNRYNDEGNYVSEALGNITTNKETLVYLPKFKTASKDDLDNLANNHYDKSTSDNRYALKTELPTIPAIKCDNINDVTKLNYRRDINAVEVFSGETGLLLGEFVTNEQKQKINHVGAKTNSYIWDNDNNQVINFGEGNEVFYDTQDGKIIKIGVKENGIEGTEQKAVIFDEFAKQEQINDLHTSISELANKTGGLKITDDTYGELKTGDSYYFDSVDFGGSEANLSQMLHLHNDNDDLVAMNVAPTINNPTPLYKVTECNSTLEDFNSTWNQNFMMNPTSTWNVNTITQTDATTGETLTHLTGNILVRSIDARANGLKDTPTTNKIGADYMTGIILVLDRSFDPGITSCSGNCTVTAGSGTNAVNAYNVPVQYTFLGNNLKVSFLSETWWQKLGQYMYDNSVKTLQLQFWF